MSIPFREQWGLRLFLFFVLMLVMFKGLANAADLQVKVIHIADGDTITVLNYAKEQIKIRLNGIDCPKKDKPMAKRPRKLPRILLHSRWSPLKHLAKTGMGGRLAKSF